MLPSFLPRLLGVATISAALLCSGCASMSNARTGFLDHNEQLKSDPKDAHRLVFEKPDWKRSEFTRVLLEPTVVRLGPKDQKKLTAQEIAELGAYVDTALRKAFAKDLTLVTTAEAGTLRIRAAVTGIDTSNPTLNVVTGVLLWPVDNGGVSLEFDVRDSTNDERLTALAGYSEGALWQVIGSFSRFGHAHSGIDHWVAELHKLVRPAEPKIATN